MKIDLQTLNYAYMQHLEIIFGTSQLTTQIYSMSSYNKLINYRHLTSTFTSKIMSNTGYNQLDRLLNVY